MIINKITSVDINLPVDLIASTFGTTDRITRVKSGGNVIFVHDPRVITWA